MSDEARSKYRVEQFLCHLLYNLPYNSQFGLFYTLFFTQWTNFQRELRFFHFSFWIQSGKINRFCEFLERSLSIFSTINLKIRNNALKEKEEEEEEYE